MAQPIKPAQVQMELASAADGMTGMRRTSAVPGEQIRLDPTASPLISNQPQRQMQLGQQNMRNRVVDAQMQYKADATRQGDEMLRSAGEAQQMARDLRANTVAQILDGTSAPATALLFGEKGMAEKVTRDAMTNQAIGERLNPDLGDYSGQLMA